ncbi:MAG: hypothetical protein Q9220_004492 [cf. Caloplaca sp. 1 TL-2023]
MTSPSNSTSTITEKTDPRDRSASNIRSVSKDLDQTEAHILPDTSDDTTAEQLSDTEKGSDNAKPAFAGFDPSSFPDGGLQAWLAVSGAFCCLFCSFGWINCKRALPSASESCGPIFGKLYDSYGPRYLLLTGSFLHIFGLMMASLCSKYYQFLLAQGVCSPIGASMIFYPAMNSTGTWFFKRRALAFGIMASGSSLGGVILPIMVDKIIAHAGFPWAMRGVSFLLLGLLIYANLTVRSRLPPSPKPWTLLEFIRPLGELSYFLVVFASFLFFFGMFLPFTFVILSAQHDGMSTDLAFYLIPILNAVSIFGRTIPGYIADKLGRFNTMIFTSFLSTVVVLGLWLPARGNVPYILFSAFYGFSSGAFVSLAPALIAQISDIRQIGIRTGSMFAVVSVAALVGTPIGGQLVSNENGSYLHLQIFCGIMMFAGSVVFVAARWTMVGLNPLVKV